jgi:integrase
MASYRKISNKWSVVFDMPADGGKRRQKRMSGYNSRREAELAYIAYKGENKEIKPKGRHNFKTVYDRYIAYQTNRIKESSLLALQDRVKRHVLPYFSDFDVTEVKSMDIIDWQSWLNAKGLGYVYKDGILSNLKAFFMYCVEIEGIISESPCKRQIKFVRTEAAHEMLIYEPEEYKQFRSVIEDLNDLVLFDLLYFTGPRKGEVIALQWLDFKGNKIAFTKTYSRKTKQKIGWKLTTPKSKNSVREVLLPDVVIKGLVKLKEFKKPAPNDFIFGGEFPLSERHFETARDKYYKAAAVKRIRIHDFRHSHVSYLISQNADIVTIAKRIGDTVETVLETYTHLMPNKQQGMIDSLNAIIPNHVIKT